MAAKRVLRREILLRECLINDHDFGRACGVARRKFAPLDQEDSRSRKETWPHHVEPGHLSLLRRLPFDPNRSKMAARPEREVPAQGSGHHARHALDALCKLLIHQQRICLLILPWAQPNPHDQHVFYGHAGVHCGQFSEASRQ